MDNFPRNLRQLCTLKKSISEVCREIGINRQQFNRYLTGATRPSGNNLYRIARYFGVTVEELFLPNAEFGEVISLAGIQVNTAGHDRLGHLLNEAVHRKVRNLRKYIGYYQSYFVSPERNGRIASAFISMYEAGGLICSKSYERSHGDEQSSRYFSKYEGLVSESHNCIFVVEFEVLSKDAIVETILFKPYRRQLSYLSGLTMGMDGERKPFCTPIIWKYLGSSPDIRLGMARAISYALDDPAIDATVRKLLTQPVTSSLPVIIGSDWYLDAT